MGLDTLQRITELKNRRDWTDYELAERSGLTQPTISAWYRKSYEPTVSSLEKLCEAFSITMTQFFAVDDHLVDLTPEQHELLESWSALSQIQRESLLVFLKNTKPVDGRT